MGFNVCSILLTMSHVVLSPRWHHILWQVLLADFLAIVIQAGFYQRLDGGGTVGVILYHEITMFEQLYASKSIKSTRLIDATQGVPKTANAGKTLASSVDKYCLACLVFPPFSVFVSDFHHLQILDFHAEGCPRCRCENLPP